MWTEGCLIRDVVRVLHGDATDDVKTSISVLPVLGNRVFLRATTLVYSKPTPSLNPTNIGKVLGFGPSEIFDNGSVFAPLLLTVLWIVSDTVLLLFQRPATFVNQGISNFKA